MSLQNMLSRTKVYQEIFMEKQKAIELAFKAVRDKGRDVRRYNMTVEETETEWLIFFEGRHPRPPGDELVVYVSKESGTLRIMLGE